MSAQAQRFQPQAFEVAEALCVSAVETIEERIMRALDQDITADAATHIVRPMCIIATMFISNITVVQPAIRVPCPNDELRRSQLAPSLLTGSANEVALYPLDENIYDAFARHMEMAGRGFGEYAVFTRNPGGGWDVQEFG